MTKGSQTLDGQVYMTPDVILGAVIFQGDLPDRSQQKPNIRVCINFLWF